MLSQNLENSMQKAMKYENLTKATKFGKVQYMRNNEKSIEKEILMLQKVSKYVQDDYTKNANIKQNEICEKVKEPMKNQKETTSGEIEKTKTGLPFFKSINYKLSEEFCV